MNNSVRPRAFLCIESVLFLKFDHVFITQTFNVSSSNSGTLSFDKYTSQLFSMHALKNVSSFFCSDGLMARDDCDPMYGGSQYHTSIETSSLTVVPQNSLSRRATRFAQLDVGDMTVAFTNSAHF